MEFKIKGFDQVTAWASGIILGSCVLGISLWVGKCSYSAQEAKKVQLAKEAEKIFEDSVKQSEAQRISDQKSKAIEAPAATPRTNKLAGMGFGYSGEIAPWRWMDLKNDWKICGTGKKQSPIDISGAKTDARLKTLKFFYQHDVSSIGLTNSTVEVKIPPGSWLQFDADRYDLKKAFFRTPGEHRFNGLPYELELQLYHEELSGKKLILSLQFTTGKSHSELKRLVSLLPRFDGETSEIERLNWSAFLPKKHTYWHYIGSLTTPPCTENLDWIIITQTLTASKAEIDHVAKLQLANARPTMPLNGRRISRSNR